MVNAVHVTVYILFMWAEVMCWSTVEVCNMLHCIGLSQYKENFAKKKVDGKELLEMQKQDFVVSSVPKQLNEFTYGSVFCIRAFYLIEC